MISETLPGAGGGSHGQSRVVDPNGRVLEQVEWILFLCLADSDLVLFFSYPFDACSKICLGPRFWRAAAYP